MSVSSQPPFNPAESLTNINQQQQTAAHENLHAALGLVQANVLQSFVEINKHALWKYETNSGFPTLAPLNLHRTSKGEAVEDQAWLAYVGSVLTALPQDVQDKLAELNRLSPQERNPESFPDYGQWKALDELVKFAAKTLAFETIITTLMKSENSQNEALYNSQLPSIVTKTMANDAEALAASLKEDLKRHKNNPEYDPCVYLVSQFETLMKNLEKEV